jgi:hypothetical protein
MTLLALEFSCLRWDPVPDPAVSQETLDLMALYNLAADQFEMSVDGGVLYREVTFPVVELAKSLTWWVRRGYANRAEFAFAPTGGDSIAVAFRPSGTGWEVFSSISRPSKVHIVPNGGVHAAVQSYVREVSSACSGLGVDFEALIGRLES